MDVTAVLACGRYLVLVAFVGGRLVVRLVAATSLAVFVTEIHRGSCATHAMPRHLVPRW